MKHGTYCRVCVPHIYAGIELLQICLCWLSKWFIIIVIVKQQMAFCVYLRKGGLRSSPVFDFLNKIVN